MTRSDAAPAPHRHRAERGRGRVWGWVVVVAAAVAVAAVGPVVWTVTRPAEQDGLTLVQARDSVAAGGAGLPSGAPASGAQEPSAQPSPRVPQQRRADPEPEPRFGAVTVRDAGLDQLAAAATAPPVRLQIAGLGVDATVDPVGVEADGSMVIPRSVDSVGWYRHGASPGDAEGNAVLAGHVDGASQGPGALFPLRGVELGERVSVTDATGQVREYEVAGRETITKGVLPVDEIFTREGPHVLVVITCGGPFQPELRSYRDNVVVTAVPVQPQGQP